MNYACGIEAGGLSSKSTVVSGVWPENTPWCAGAAVYLGYAVKLTVISSFTAILYPVGSNRYSVTA